MDLVLPKPPRISDLTFRGNGANANMTITLQDLRIIAYFLAICLEIINKYINAVEDWTEGAPDEVWDFTQVSPTSSPEHDGQSL